MDEPPRFALLRQFGYLATHRPDVVDWHQWATDLLGRPIDNFTSLTKTDLTDLIDEIVLSAKITRPCRSVSSDDQSCIHHWPGHPLWCTDTDGNEWLPKEI